MTLEELRQRLAAEQTRSIQLAAEIEHLAAKPSLTEGEQQRWNQSKKAVEKSTAAVAAMKEEIRQQVMDAVEDGTLQFEPGDGVTETAEVRAHNLGDGVSLMRSREARKMWSGPVDTRNRESLRSTALAVIEHGDNYVERYQLDDSMPVNDAVRSRLETLVRNDEDGNLSQYVVAASSPDYASAFTRCIRGQQYLLSDAERHAMREVERTETRASLAEGNTGAFMVPFYLDPTILETNVGSMNPFRQIARVETITTSAWHGVTSAGATAEWTAESAQVSDATPVLTQPAISPVRGDCHIQVTIEQLADSSIGSQIAELLNDARQRLESDAHATGSGSTQPTGVVTALNLVTASRITSVSTAAYGSTDVFNVDNDLPARYRANASWVGRWSTWNATRQFSVGSGALSGAFWATLGDNQPERLVGHSVYTASSMATNTVTGARILVLGDFKQGFVIVDRIGMSILVNPYVVGANGRPIGETGMTGFFRTGSGVINPDAFRMLVIK